MQFDREQFLGAAAYQRSPDRHRYLSRIFQRDLFEKRAIKLETPLRKNQLDFNPFCPTPR